MNEITITERIQSLINYRDALLDEMAYYPSRRTPAKFAKVRELDAAITELKAKVR